MLGKSRREFSNAYFNVFRCCLLDCVDTADRPRPPLPLLKVSLELWVHIVLGDMQSCAYEKVLTLRNTDPDSQHLAEALKPGVIVEELFSTGAHSSLLTNCVQFKNMDMLDGLRSNSGDGRKLIGSNVC